MVFDSDFWNRISLRCVSKTVLNVLSYHLFPISAIYWWCLSSKVTLFGHGWVVKVNILWNKLKCHLTSSHYTGNIWKVSFVYVELPKLEIITLQLVTTLVQRYRNQLVWGSQARKWVLIHFCSGFWAPSNC